MEAGVFQAYLDACDAAPVDEETCVVAATAAVAAAVVAMLLVTACGAA